MSKIQSPEENPKKTYLYNGIRDKLAGHFNLSLEAIDKRLQRSHPETVEKALQFREEYKRAQIQAQHSMKLLREGKL